MTKKTRKKVRSAAKTSMAFKPGEPKATAGDHPAKKPKPKKKAAGRPPGPKLSKRSAKQNTKDKARKKRGIGRV